MTALTLPCNITPTDILTVRKAAATGNLFFNVGETNLIRLGTDALTPLRNLIDEVLADGAAKLAERQAAEATPKAAPLPIGTEVTLRDGKVRTLASYYISSTPGTRATIICADGDGYNVTTSDGAYWHVFFDQVEPTAPKANIFRLHARDWWGEKASYTFNRVEAQVYDKAYADGLTSGSGNLVTVLVGQEPPAAKVHIYMPDIGCWWRAEGCGNTPDRAGAHAYDATEVAGRIGGNIMVPVGEEPPVTAAKPASARTPWRPVVGELIRIDSSTDDIYGTGTLLEDDGSSLPYRVAVTGHTDYGDPAGGRWFYANEVSKLQVEAPPVTVHTPRRFLPTERVHITDNYISTATEGVVERDDGSESATYYVRLPDMTDRPHWFYADQLEALEPKDGDYVKVVGPSNIGEAISAPRGTVGVASCGGNDKHLLVARIHFPITSLVVVEAPVGVKVPYQPQVGDRVTIPHHYYTEATAGTVTLLDTDHTSKVLGDGDDEDWWYDNYRLVLLPVVPCDKVNIYSPSLATWYLARGAGYTNDRAVAHVYTRAKAEVIVHEDNRPERVNAVIVPVGHKPPSGDTATTLPTGAVAPLPATPTAAKPQTATTTATAATSKHARGAWRPVPGERVRLLPNGMTKDTSGVLSDDDGSNCMPYRVVDDAGDWIGWFDAKYVAPTPIKVGSRVLIVGPSNIFSRGKDSKHGVVTWVDIEDEAATYMVEVEDEHGVHTYERGLWFPATSVRAA
jgi:hypothetical protein